MCSLLTEPMFLYFCSCIPIKIECFVHVYYIISKRSAVPVSMRPNVSTRGVMQLNALSITSILYMLHDLDLNTKWMGHKLNPWKHLKKIKVEIPRLNQMMGFPKQFRWLFFFWKKI